jgi:hypothetical protein
MHEGGRRNPRVVVPWARDAAIDIREEFGTRAVRAARLQEQPAEESPAEESVDGTEAAERIKDGAAVASEIGEK